MNKQFLAVLAIGAVAVVLGCKSEKPNALAPANSTPSYTFITNGAAAFWEHARAGVDQAGKDLGVNVTVIVPQDMVDQTRQIEDLLTRGTDGIAISAIEPENQAEILNKAAAKTNLISHDSDAPHTNRLLYIGMDNYDAGLLCGQTLRKAMPEGGSVMIFVGRMDQDNAKHRRQGCIDGLLGRTPDKTRNDPTSGEIKSDDGKFTILGTMTDQFDRAKAKANVEDAITRYPDLAGIMGLFEYNPPLALEALNGTGKLGKIKVMGFDENMSTLDGIKDGTMVGTVVQNPYQYGYKSIQTLNELHKGNKSVIPENKFVDIPARVIDTSNVDAFSKEIKERLSKK